MLSLASNFSVQPSVRWTHIPFGDLANAGSTGLSFMGDYSLHPNPPLRISNEHVQQAKRLYQALLNLDKTDIENLKIPITRWMRSKKGPAFNVVNRTIDLGIALECLYLRNAGSELRYRLSLFGAWFLGQNREERATIAKQLRDIYDARSKAVHEGLLENGDDLMWATKFVGMAQDLCRRTIVKIIEEGGFPDWDDLVLG